MIDPLQRVTSYRYTLTGQLAAVTAFGGTLHEFVDDRKNRLTEVAPPRDRHGRVSL